MPDYNLPTLTGRAEPTIRVTILGAGGNMGRRITRSLLEYPEYELRFVEPSPHGRELMAELGVSAVETAEAVRGAELVVFAINDSIVKDVAKDVVPMLDAGTSMLFLDPAALASDRIPRRDDVNCYVVHPTHPPLYSLLEEETAEARRDFWGGGLARQALVFATAWGGETEAERAQRLAEAMFAPISTCHRITVSQMAMLEPALSETLTNGCISLIHDGMERVIEAGVPAEATYDFLMGHIQIGLALIFDQLDWKLSEGAQLALRESKRMLFRDDWDRIFEPEEVLASVRRITDRN
ncbi:MAG TPA: phosphogluconate dehydrogenase C-terminal domain-containing protein [Solirubrobacteraceae bacterium]|nr:phosphogluconate dehydrogenase C-terminal domain-containing protein [Solirubrobacteraceae bacterium]